MAVIQGLFKLCMVLGILHAGEALTCHQCSDLEFNSGNSVLKSLFGGKTDPACASGSSGASVQCDAGESCVAYRGEVTGNVFLMGSFRVNAVVRDCMAPGDLGSGCHGADSASQAVKGVLGVVLGFLTGVSGMGVDGSLCLCSDNMCVPDCSGFFIGDYCMTWVIMGVCAGALVILLILLCSCCCCCCGCCGCRKSQPQYTQPSVIVVSPQGGVENPGYGQNNVM